jgi:aminoglycoside phosphotransferase (APT) family kinase protein
MSLVHADFVDKNLRLRRQAEAPIVPFDWEMSGWGVPLRDLGMVDLGAYLASGRSFWGPRARELGRLADIGRLFTLLAGIEWERVGLEIGWLPRHRRHLPVYHERLGSVLVRLGMLPTAAKHRSGATLTPQDDRIDAAITTDRLLRGLRFMERRIAAQVVAVIDRAPNVYRSTFPSEIVRCMFEDGVERTLFVKRYVPGLQDGDPFWEGGPYEARIYEEVLAAHDLCTPRYFGSWSDAGTGDTFLVLEYLEGWRLARSDPSWLVEGARWLGRLHRDATPTALAQPGVRRYDGSFFGGRARHALGSVAMAHPQEAWMDGLVRSFDTVMVPRLLAGDHVFIHGEPYPANMIVNGGRIRTVDWQSAAIGPWAVDLACLTEGDWPADSVRASEAAYARERWPDGPPSSFDTELEAARVYWSLRWLGVDTDATTATRQAGYIERLRTSAERLGLLETAG